VSRSHFIGECGTGDRAQSDGAARSRATIQKYYLDAEFLAINRNDVCVLRDAELLTIDTATRAVKGRNQTAA
jgi:hypothetical protein